MLETAARTVSDQAREIQVFKDLILAKLRYSVGRDPATAQLRDWFMATAHALRDTVVDQWIATRNRVYAEDRKRVYYLSVEFLIGRLLFDTLSNLGLVVPVREALAELGVDLDEIREMEPDAALGNGGLGRLAACFMDSLASLDVAAYGYGIRYDYGLFRQHILDGWQQEMPENWLSFGNPWEFERHEMMYPIRFGGLVEYIGGDADTARGVWYPAETVNAVAYDTPVVGWRGRHVNTLRLWSARATEPIHLHAFHQGDYVGAVAARTQAEAISRILYPSDATQQGQELRLRQEYFFTSASLQDIVRRHIVQYDDLASLPDHTAIQLNDTHPAIAVAELMRILVDEHEFSWTDAWRVTRATLSYTNHTLLPEALEAWPVSLMNRLLPRHMQIIYLINWLQLKEQAELGNSDPAKVASISLIEEAGDKRVRMGHLAFLGSHKVNGVSALHTGLMRSTVFRDLDTAYPGQHRQQDQRHHIPPLAVPGEPGLDQSHRRGARRARAGRSGPPGGARAAGGQCRVRRPGGAGAPRQQGSAGASHPPYRGDPVQFLDAVRRADQAHPRVQAPAAQHPRDGCAVPGDPRQPRGRLGAACQDLRRQGRGELRAREAHHQARERRRPRGQRRSRGARPAASLVFLPNYNVSLAEAIIPAADLSEQISTAGMEASGTGNMKFALNGALTIGTLDGANVEIREHVGADNIFIFGLNAEEVEAQRRACLTGRDVAEGSARLARAVEGIAAGLFSPDDPSRFHPLTDAVLGHDHFMTAADFDAYWQAQRAIDALWSDPLSWWRVSILNTARMGWFSSDRTIREYAQEIWQVPTRGDAIIQRS